MINLNLDFNTPALQQTNIILNQANKDSVSFNIRVYIGAAEINYLDYDRAEMVFQKPDRSNVTVDVGLSDTGLVYSLDAEIFAVTGLVKGYVNFYQGGAVAATLYYNFMILPDLLNPEAVSGSYVSAIEKVLIEAQKVYVQIEKVLSDAGGIVDAEMDAVRDRINNALAGIEQALADHLDNIDADVNSRIADINQATNDALQMVEDARAILEGLESGAFATIDYVNTSVSNLAVKDGSMQENLNAALLDGLGKDDFAFADDLNNHIEDLDIHVSSTQAALIASAVQTGNDGLSQNGTTVFMPDVATAGTYLKVTIDAKGRVIGYSAVSAADLPAIPWTQLSGVPANVTNALNAATGGSVSGALTLTAPLRFGSGSGLAVVQSGGYIDLTTNVAVGGGANDNHTGIRLVAGGMSGWNTAKLYLAIGSNWGTYGTLFAVIHAGNLAAQIGALGNI
jgi:ElaB/YqjD/DUF883 family membrane-anchored ribosome-binding protein